MSDQRPPSDRTPLSMTEVLVDDRLRFLQAAFCLFGEHLDCLPSDQRSAFLKQLSDEIYAALQRAHLRVGEVLRDAACKTESIGHDAAESKSPSACSVQELSAFYAQWH